MSSSKSIFWLCSYLKSGNTWFRIFLANLLNHSKMPIDINSVEEIINENIVLSRNWLDNICGFNTSLLSHTELEKLQPQIYKWFGQSKTEISYHKSHKAYTYLENNVPLIPSEGCLGTLYFIRNPLDIVVSMENHLPCTFDEAIDFMAYRIKPDYYHYLPQKFLSWSDHINSWTNAKNINFLLLRYEDMVQNTNITFTKAVRFLRLNYKDEIIQAAIQHSSFKKLQKFENDIGFLHKPPKLQNFFRKGIVGDWKNILTDKQIQQVIKDHGETMHKFGYLDENGKPI